MGRIDHVNRSIHRVLGIDTGLAARSRHGKQSSYDDFLWRLGKRRAYSNGEYGSAGSQQLSAIHDGVPFSVSLQEACVASVLITRGLHRMASCVFLRSVTSIAPGACVIANG